MTSRSKTSSASESDHECWIVDPSPGLEPPPGVAARPPRRAAPPAPAVNPRILSAPTRRRPRPRRQHFAGMKSGPPQPLTTTSSTRNASSRSLVYNDSRHPIPARHPGGTPVSHSEQHPAEIPAKWVSDILDREQNDVRFEAFATDLVSTLQDQPVLSTSRSWDLGRDARGYGSQRGVYVLTTLRTDADKALQDAARLTSTRASITHIYYVAPRVVSEHALEDHRRAIRNVVGDNISIDPLGRPQIVGLVSSGRDGLAFRRHYAGELASITHVLTIDASVPQSTHLELALCTFGAKDTGDLRVALTSRLLLRLLETRHRSVHDLESLKRRDLYS